MFFRRPLPPCSLLTRIFTILAWFAILLMAAVVVLGLMVGDLHTAPTQDTLVWARVHRLIGVAAAMVVVLVNSIAVTYFIGTSRWCKEVVDTYSLDRELARRSARLKRRTFPWAVMAMLSVVGVSALGAAADPGTLRPGTENWVTSHLAAALAGLAVVAWAFFVEWNNIFANHGVISDILAEVKRIRAEHGLDDTSAG